MDNLPDDLIVYLGQHFQVYNLLIRLCHRFHRILTGRVLPILMKSKPSKKELVEEGLEYLDKAYLYYVDTISLHTPFSQPLPHDYKLINSERIITRRVSLFDNKTWATSDDTIIQYTRYRDKEKMITDCLTRYSNFDPSPLFYQKILQRRLSCICKNPNYVEEMMYAQVEQEINCLAQQIHSGLDGHWEFERYLNYINRAYQLNVDLDRHRHKSNVELIPMVLERLRENQFMIPLK